MKYLLTALLFCTAVLGADKPAAHKKAASKTAARGKSAVEQCFKVRRLLKTDATHYWADWTNTCPYTIEAVYVMVGFRDGGQREMGSGVWPMYFVKPGVHRVTRFSAPVEGFETVLVHRITTDSAMALGPDPAARVKAQTGPPGTVGDTAIGKVLPYRPAAGNTTQF